MKLVIVTLLTMYFIFASNDVNANGVVVKLSKNKICHTSQSRHFATLKYVKLFDSMQSCIDAGGRPVKGNKTTSKPAKNSYYSHQPYDRKQYPHWQDTDKDCQNTRHELLIAQSLVPVKFKRNKGCTVTHGKWFDPYTNRTWTKASDVDIDHVVPLFHAHTHNAAQWDRKRKGQFANDPENLLIVEDNANQSKSAQAPHEWMPDNTNYHCEYLKKWVYVKTKYNLRMSKDESRFVKRRLSACSN